MSSTFCTLSLPVFSFTFTFTRMVAPRSLNSVMSTRAGTPSVSSAITALTVPGSPGVSDVSMCRWMGVSLGRLCSSMGTTSTRVKP